MRADANPSLIEFLYRAPIGLLQAAMDGTIEMINPMAARLLMPLSANGSLDNIFATLATVAPQLQALVQEHEPATGVVCESMRVAAPSATTADAAATVLSLSLMKFGEAKLMAVISDVTLEVQREQQGLDRRLRDAARTDSLTRMPNRAALQDRVAQAMARAASDPTYGFAVIFMNCNRFKQINDTLGHAAGDEVLGMMADRLRSTLRLLDPIALATCDDDMAARVGGDEFAVLVSLAHRPDDVHAVANRLRDVLSQPYGVGEQQAHCDISMGIVLGAQATGTADLVIQAASMAMVEAKRNRSARYVIFEPAMRERAARRGSIEADLHRALTEDQLFVVYQPVVELLGEGQVNPYAGVEALVRWRHPTRGIVPPLEFISVAEECGLIGPLGDHVLATACRDFVRWQRELGPHAPALLAVNLSRAQLTQPGLTASVQDLLAATGMPPRRLQLEITESLAAQDESISMRLRELKALGLTLALDDFGTGYSSLASLHLLPVDIVKIDRSFVSQAASSHHHQVLIEATIRVAQSLGMGTVAEGIETEAQAEVVTRLGCDKGQGYLFSKPLTTQDLERWLQAAAMQTPSA